ncbi:ferredoxin [Streptomyces armeniacus]|nr:(4Fe-4S)-binding protein [Streptomyces armeniacus]
MTAGERTSRTGDTGRTGRTAGLRITADRERCVGSGMCVLNEDSVFDQSEEDGRVVLLTDTPGPEVEATVRYAIQWCPARALSLTED